jgi:hypothetical protein
LGKHSRGNGGCAWTLPRCCAGAHARRQSSTSGVGRICGRPMRRPAWMRRTASSTSCGTTGTGPSSATGATLDCRLSATRDADAAACCFRPVLQASHTRTPRVSTGDKNAAYSPAFAALQPDSPRPQTCRLRQGKYLKNLVEPDHRWVQHRGHPGGGLGAFAPAPRTIQGDEARHMLRQGQCEGGIKGAVLAQHRVINQRFGGAASRALAQPLLMVPVGFATLPCGIGRVASPALRHGEDVKPRRSSPP